MSSRVCRWLALILALILCAQASLYPAYARQALYLSDKTLILPSGDSEQLTANQRVMWSSSDTRVATVAPDGTVSAHMSGTALIVGRSESGQRKAVRVEVKAAPKPKRVTISPNVKVLPLGDTLKLSAAVLPEGASQKVRWLSSNKKVATVSAEGVVAPRREGKVRISVRSRAKTSVRATVALTVVDPKKPTSVSLTPQNTYLNVGDAQTLTATVLPDTADKALTWSSSRPDVVSVDDAGRLRAVAPGQAVITVQTVRGKLKAQANVGVLGGERVSRVPARTTGTGAQVAANIAAIDAVYASALDELTRLAATRMIDQGDFDKRKRILINAFAMYRFPWQTQKNVPYWSRAYGGRKDFRKGVVYYGLPYIQTGADARYTNRRYNVAKALAGGFYKKTSGGVYRMTTKRQAGRYVGNDCSAFVCLATFPGNGYSLSSSTCYLVTSEMAKNSAFKTIKSYDDLRPGDALVLSGDHTVMFLYYLDANKNRMMIIEQGGGNLTTDIHNTVTCSVVNRSSYSGKYTVRRAKFLK